MCVFLGESLLDSATAMQILLASKNLRKTSGFGRCVSKIKYPYFISAIKGITSRINYIHAIYFASVVLKEIYICKLLHHNTGHPVHVITYFVHDITFSA